MAAEVSVVIAAKNEQLYVRQAVDSVLYQKGVDFELVFVDDGSTDATRDIVENICHPRLKFYRNPSCGKVSAFNFGVSRAEGKWICIFAGDDIMPAGSLAARWEAVKDIASDKPVIGLSRLVQMSEIKKQDGIVIPKNPHRGGFTGVSYLMDRRAAEKIYPVPEELPNEDTWTETGVLHFDNMLVHSGVIGCKWRVHENNSMNFLVPWSEFNKRLAPRMRAYEVFLARYGDVLSADSRRRLIAKVRAEEGRRSGNVIKITRSGATFVETLRAISLSGPIFYEIRRRLYGLLSGW